VSARRRWRCATACIGALALAGGVLVLAGGPIAWPFDVMLNLGGAIDEPELRALADGAHRVVVLQHGLFRTSASLGRLERTLERHGYEVLNIGYASTTAPIEEHAASLARAIAARLAAGPVDEWSFVGHSMGGLVIEEYLRRADAVVPRACVYLATPHRGAVLADLRKNWFLFRLSMGTTAALQLSPGDALHRRPIPFPERSGTIVGDLGDGNASIPGPDDGTVGVDEATFAGASATVRLPVGHTRIAADPEALREVLHFLRRGTFAPRAAKQ
jgi:pimeloyl-ACP methyl ester carboxylesterase